jgi:hypothetical protein
MIEMLIKSKDLILPGVSVVSCSVSLRVSNGKSKGKVHETARI